MFEKLNRWLEQNAVAAQALLAAVTLLVFSGTLANGFVYDDNPQIIQNPFVTNPHLWTKMFSGSVWSFQGAATNFYRPLQFVSYWLLYRLAGANPVPFHLLNLLLYAATVILVYRLGGRLGLGGLAAFGGALLWALHPVHVEAVAWISCLPDVGFALFCLIAFLLFLRAENEPGHPLRLTLLSALAFLPALFFKEMALSFPLVLVTWWFFLGQPESWRHRAARWFPYLLAVAIYIAARHFALGYFSETRHFWRLNRVVIGSTLGLLGDHARILLWPQRLTVYRMFNLRASLFSPWPWATLAVILSTLWIRKRDPRLAFLIAWWPVALLPVLDIRQLSFPQLADRFNYFPSIGPCLAVACLLLERRPAPVRRFGFQAAGAAALALAEIVFAVETARYIPHWQTNDALINYSLRQAPNSPLLHMARGMELEYQDGDLGGALREYQTAWRLNQKSTWPLGLAHDYYLALGRIALRRGRRNQAIRYFKKVIAAAPNGYSDATDALGAVYFPDGDYGTAARYFARSLQLNPQDLGARFYLGSCLMKLGHYRQAAEQFHAARKTDPQYWQAYRAEAQALDAAGDPAAAARVRQEIHP